MVVDPQPHMTYQPFLPEAAAGNISPRHTVVPLRRELRRCTDRGRRGHPDRARPQGRPPCSRSSARPGRSPYDHIIVAPGSVSRTLPIPGLREHAVGFKTIGEAIYLRNHVLDRLDVAAATTDPADPAAGADLRLRRRRLRRHRGARRDGGHGPRRAALLPGARAGRHALGAGRGDPAGPARGRPGHGRVHGASSCSSASMDIRLGTRLESCVDGVVKLSDGDSFAADTIVWTAGVKPSPMLDAHRLAARRPGPVTCLPDAAGGRRRPGGRGRVERRRLRRGAGPDRSEPGDVLLAERPARGAPGRAGWPTTSRAVIRGRQPVDYRHKHVGSWPASACTRAWPRCTASRSRAGRPGSCTGRTT